MVFFDALRVKMREDGVVRNKAVYLTLGVLPDGTRDILGLWIETIPSDEAATKLLWLALRNITGKWGSSTHDWKAAMNQFAILYEERFTHPHR